jgi:AcrR family transcriptional regulator
LSTPEGQKLETRDRILEAAERVMRTRGLARATTKEIARAAGCSEGNLYNHFENKESLFLAVMTERLPGFIPLIQTLHQWVGTGSVRANLTEIARTALAFYIQFLPMSSAILATPELRQGLRHRGGGPHRANQGIAAYLHREQLLGRIHPDASPEAAAALLLGACQQRAVHALFLDDESLVSPAEGFAEELVNTLMQGLAPEEE